MEEKIWQIKPLTPSLAAELSRTMGVSLWTSQLLINRGVETPEEAEVFLRGGFSHLYSPRLLDGIDKAVDRALRAVRESEKILIYGDYDVDGITSVCLLSIVLKEIGAHISYYLPHRLREGYGLNIDAIRKAKDRAINLIITCDCGMDAYEEITMAKKEGMDTIVLDHHRTKDNIPPAVAVVNPHLCSYPFKALAGVGVAFKFAQALAERVPSLKVQKHLDLVGLGTVSDIVPLVNENRILVKHGIEALNPSEKRGIEALKEVSGIKNRRIDTRDIAFILAPRLNAGGRMDTAYDGVKMLLSHDPKEAKRIASKLEKDNRERQRVEQEIFKDAVKIIEENSDLKKERVLVIAEKGWHPGVIGIVASRLAERFSRPSILISLEKDRGRGSGRSIGGFNLFESINSLKGYLQKFGGHKYACGLEISENNIHPFRIEINRLAEEIPVEEFKPTLYVDALLSFDTLTFSMVKEFSLLSPFGLGNEEPLFITKNVEIMANPKIVSSNHIKFWVRHNNFHREVIGFGKGEYAPLLTKKQTVDLLYTPELDLWNGRNSVILKMKDIRIKNEKS